jgi:cytochrome c5
MLKKTLIPLALVALLAACGKQEEAPAPAAEPAAAAAPAAPAAPATPVPTEAVATTAAAPAANEAGEKVFKSTCAMCHQSGAAGAPIAGNKDDWGPRIAQGKDTLYTHAINGFTGQKGAMPAKGGNTSLADADVKAAVDYMVAKAQ